MRLTAILGTTVGLLGLSLPAALTIAPAPFSSPSGRPTGLSSGTATATGQGPAPAQTGFLLPAVDGGGLPGYYSSKYDNPIATVPQAAADAIPSVALTAYQRAAQALAVAQPQCHLTWPVLAGIGKVESNHGGGGELQADGTAVIPILGPELNGTHGNPAVRDTDHGALDGDALWDRAVGPLQILPSLWRHWAATDRPGVPADPQNVFDSALTAGGLLCAAHGDLRTASGLQRALSAYRQAQGYNEAVVAWAMLYAAESLAVQPPGSPLPPSWPLVLPTAALSGAASPSAPAPSHPPPQPSRSAATATPTPSRIPGPPHSSPSSACTCSPEKTIPAEPRR